MAVNQADYGAARSLYEESLAIARQRDDTHSIAWVLEGLGEVARRNAVHSSFHSLDGRNQRP